MALSKVGNIAMRGLQFLWTLLVMSLIGNMIAQRVGGSPAIINYYMFTAAFSMLSLFYLVPATIKEGFSGHPMILLAVDVLNTIFTFCAAVALPSYQHVHSCNNRAYLDSNSITNGTWPANREKRCREAQASTAFMWFLFAAFLVSTVLDGFQGRSAGAGLRGPRRTGGAQMAQV